MNFVRIVLSLISIAFICSNNAWADLNLEIVGGINQSRKIAVVPFAGVTDTQNNLSAIVKADLARSGTFAPIDERNILARPTRLAEVQKSYFANDVEVAVVGTVTPSEKKGVYAVTYELVSLQGVTPKQLLAFKAEVPKSKMRQYAHRISNAVYEKLTGIKGAYNTRIAFIRYIHGTKHPYELCVADYDGYNEVKLVRSSQPLMSPSWSNDGKRIVYVSFENRKSEIYIYSLENRKRTKVTSFSGLNSNPSWSPDGSKIAMVLSKDGNPEIYMFHVGQNRLTRVTTNSAIDTEPAWSADSKSIYFTSDRTGRPQIYNINITNGALQRVTSQPVKNFSPAPTVDNGLVLVNQSGGFRIAHLDEQGKMDYLSNGSLDESPTVSPNGKMVLYSSLYGGKKQLMIVSTDGRFKARIPSGTGDISSPSWSPYL